MKILFLSQYFPPDITAAAFRVSETAKLLNNKGFQVVVLTAEPHRIRVEESLKVKYKYKVIRSPIKRLKKGGTLNYVIHYISFMLSSILWGIFKTNSKFDYVIASSGPLFNGISGLLLSKIKRAKFIFDVRDLEPDTAVAANQLNPEGIFYNRGKMLERFLYNNADLITCVSEDMKSKILKMKSSPNPIEVIYNSINEKTFMNWEREFGSKTNDNVNKDFTISYAGNIGYLQNLRVIIEAAKSLKKEKVKFILIGDGVERSLLESEVEKRGLDNVVFKGPYNKKTAFHHMLSSSAMLVHLKSKEVLFNTIPSKFFDYLYANKPILYGIKGEGKRFLDKLPGNIYFEPEEPESLSNAVKRLLTNYEYFSENAKQNRDFLLRNFTRERMVDKLINFIERYEK